MAINNTTIIPIIWAGGLRRTLNEEFVWGARTNRTWEAELSAGGDRVRTNELATYPTIGDYNDSNGITYQDMDAGTPIDIVVNKNKYWAGYVKDVVRVQSNPELLSEFLRRAAHGMAKQIDDDIRAKVKTDATDAGALALDHNVAADLDPDKIEFTKMRRLMNLAHVPMGARWCIVGPYTQEFISRAWLDKQIVNQQVGDTMNKNGFLAEYQNFRFYEDNGNDSVLNTTDATNHIATETMYFGNDYATALIVQMQAAESMRSQTHFRDLVRGQVLYGMETVETGTIFKRTVTIQHVP